MRVCWKRLSSGQVRNIESFNTLDSWVSDGRFSYSVDGTSTPSSGRPYGQSRQEEYLRNGTMIYPYHYSVFLVRLFTFVVLCFPLFCQKQSLSSLGQPYILLSSALSPDGIIALSTIYIPAKEVKLHSPESKSCAGACRPSNQQIQPYRRKSYQGGLRLLNIQNQYFILPLIMLIWVITVMR